MGGMSLEAVDFPAGGAGHDTDGLTVDDQPEGVVSVTTVTILPAWVMPTWMRWRATWMPPREETRRCAVTVASGKGAGPARRTPWRRCRWPGGMGQGRVRHNTPSWVITCISCPSRRIRARCPASGEPTRISRFSRVTPPMPLTSRSTSTHLLAARAPGDGPAGGGPAGRASARRNPAKSASERREGTVLIRHPPTLKCTVVVSIHRVTCLPGAGGAEPKLLPAGPQVPRRRDHPVHLDRIRPASELGGGNCVIGCWWRGDERFQVSRRPQTQRVTLLYW